MSILAWWAIPVAVALLTGALMTLRGRRPRVRGSFEEIEHFQRFRDALASVLAHGVPRIVVDLSGVAFMSSAGVGVLMGVRRVLADAGGSLVLASPHGEVAQVLSITGVAEVIPVADSVADAVARLGS